MIPSTDLLWEMKNIRVKIFTFIFQIDKSTEMKDLIIRGMKGMTIGIIWIKISNLLLLNPILCSMISKMTFMVNKEFRKDKISQDNKLIQDNKINKIKEIPEKILMILKILINIILTLLTILLKETFICLIIIEFLRIGNSVGVYILIGSLNTLREQENNSKTSILGIKYSTE